MLIKLLIVCPIILLFTCTSSGSYFKTVNISFSEQVIKKTEQIIETNFANKYCVQIISDFYIPNIVEMVMERNITVYNSALNKTAKCGNYLLVFENVSTVCDRMSLLPQDGKFVILSASLSPETLQQLVTKHLYLDVIFMTITTNSTMTPQQLGFVVGNNGLVNLRKRKFSFVGVRNPPFIVFDPKKNIQLSGIEVRVVRELSSAMNLKFSPHEPYDKQGWGDRNVSGHWTGLKGELTYGYTDIGIALLYLNYEHYSLFQLTAPYTMVCLSFLVPAPSKILGHWLSLLKPLTLSSWLAFFGVSLVYIFVFYLITRKSIVICILETVRSAALVSGPQPSGPISHRILVVSWLLGSFFVANLYSSELSSWMMAQITRAPIRTLGDLARSKVVWGHIDSNMLHHLEQAATNAINRDLIRKFELENSLEDIEKKVLRGNYAVVVHILSDGYPTGAEFLSAEARRSLIPLAECVSKNHVSIGMRKGLPLIKPINLEISRLQEAGLIQEWQARDVRMFGDQADYRNLKSSKDEVLALELSNLGGAFAFWMLGNTLALLVFFYETVLVKFKIVYKPRHRKIRHAKSVLR